MNWQALLAQRVPVLWFAISIVAFLFETTALAAITDRAKWIPTSWVFITHPLRGVDGTLSFTKLFDLLIVAAYSIRGPEAIPSTVAITLIASAHGTKVLLAALNAKFPASTESTTIIRPGDTSKDPATPKVITTKKEVLPADPAVLPHASGEG